MTQEELTIWQMYNDKNAHFCSNCNKSIWYKNTNAKLSTRGKKIGNPLYSGTSYKTKKILNNVEYKLQICYYCLLSKEPSFSYVNNSKIFNTLNKYTSYAFNIPPNIINECNKNAVPTLKNMVKKYGKIEGEARWEAYKKKQAEKNTFEYKFKKYGWDLEEFNNYNKSRAVTLKNLVLKHGNIEGEKKWNSYLEKQKITKSKDYVVDKYGINYWLNLCKSKSNTLENFILRHGKDDGLLKFEEYICTMNKSLCYSSKTATEFFTELLSSNSIFKNFAVYYAGNDLGEYGKFCKTSNKYYFVDFYIKDLNLAIEFNGDYWHANPNLYEPNFSAFWHTDLTAAEIQSQDRDKIEALNIDHGIKIITVWESEVKLDKEKTINNISNIIKKIHDDKLSV
jgi:very-short-patch-repair endonuclease